MTTGKIIFLNGVTSAGKTTISKAIQELADVQFYHVSNDMFGGLLGEMLHPEKYVSEAGSESKAGDKYMAEQIVLLYHFTKTLIEQGTNVVVDGMLIESVGFTEYYGKSNYDIMRHVLKDCDVFLVEIFCPLEECRRRNIARGDRGENQSQIQHDIMNKNIEYDFFVDTSIDDADECAKKILGKLYQVKKEAGL